MKTKFKVRGHLAGGNLNRANELNEALDLQLPPLLPPCIQLHTSSVIRMKTLTVPFHTFPLPVWTLAQPNHTSLVSGYSALPSTSCLFTWLAPAARWKDNLKKSMTCFGSSQTLGDHVHPVVHACYSELTLLGCSCGKGTREHRNNNHLLNVDESDERVVMAFRRDSSNMDNISSLG